MRTVSRATVGGRLGPDGGAAEGIGRPEVSGVGVRDGVIDGEGVAVEVGAGVSVGGVVAGVDVSVAGTVGLGVAVVA
jgi:hypothetical protein